MHKHYPVLFAHSSSCVDWYISWVNDASVKTQREKDVYVCSAISLQQKSKITDLKSNQFSGFKLQNVIMQLISPVTLQEEAVALEAVLHLVLNFHREPKKIKNQHRVYCLIIIKLAITVEFKCTITSLHQQLWLLQHKPCLSNRHGTRKVPGPESHEPSLRDVLHLPALVNVLDTTRHQKQHLKLLIRQLNSVRMVRHILSTCWRNSKNMMSIQGYFLWKSWIRLQ